jgi:hypothetical protein
MYATALEHEIGSTARQTHPNLLQESQRTQRGGGGVLPFIRGTNKETRKHLPIYVASSNQKRTGKKPHAKICHFMNHAL